MISNFDIRLIYIIILFLNLNCIWDNIVLFDFFYLVGVGFVGCVFVNWLIENGQFFVLLLEVGGNDMGNYVYDIFGYIDKVV